MTSSFDPIGMLLTLLDHKVRFVLIGGYAAALRGSPMLTGDLDICYSRETENLSRLCDALIELRARLRGVDEEVPFQLDRKTLLAGDSFTFVTDKGSLDCLATPSGTFGFDDLNAGASDEGIGVATVRVASLDDLARMKRASRRPKDMVALEWIRGLQGETEGTREA
ncbi:MAG: hypothetical protein WD004_02680 [Actinomycetota bacterium]